MSAPAMLPAAGPYPSCQLLPDLSPRPGVQSSCRGLGSSACDLRVRGKSATATPKNKTCLFPWDKSLMPVFL